MVIVYTYIAKVISMSTDANHKLFLLNPAIRTTWLKLKDGMLS